MLRCTSVSEDRCYDNHDVTREARPDGAECDVSSLEGGECWTPLGQPLKRCVTQRTAPCADLDMGAVCGPWELCWHDDVLFPSSMPIYCEDGNVVSCTGKEEGAACEYDFAFSAYYLGSPSYDPTHVTEAGPEGRDLPAGRDFPVLVSKCASSECLSPSRGACYGKSEGDSCQYWGASPILCDYEFDSVCYQSIRFRYHEGVCAGALEATRSCESNQVSREIYVATAEASTSVEWDLRMAAVIAVAGAALN